MAIWSRYLAAPIRSPTPPPDRTAEFVRYIQEPLPGQSLPDGANWKHVTFISFAELDDEIIAWEYDNRGMKAVRLTVAINEIHPMALRFLALCSDPKSNVAELRTVGAQLYAWLIAPLDQSLPAARIIAIESDGVLATLPFAALVTSDGEYFGQKYISVNSLGPYSWPFLRGKDDFGPQDRILVAASPFGTALKGTVLPFLGDVYNEAQDVAQHFVNPTILAGHDANPQTLKRDLSGNRVFHFAGHSIATETSSGLIVSDGPASTTEQFPKGTLMGIAQIETLPLRSVDLVMLSSCSSAGQGSKDGSPYPLVTAFLRAGVPHIIATRWAIDSNATVGFAREFYNALFRSDHPASALRIAYASQLMSPSTSHPYYWAGFTAFGR